ncbi:hypothetical protein, partial [Bradyrhizobium sp.]|uniref:hypothetical protein n=1 Tax=Bradyrhizobium sp. TaxID=376 RepID=UPI0025C4BD89
GPYLKGMAPPLSTQENSHSAMAVIRSSGGMRSVLIWSSGALSAAALFAALVLWAHYGTTVFFEMIAAGFAACF